MTKEYKSLEHSIRDIVEGKSQNNFDVDSIVENVMEELKDDIEYHLDNLMEHFENIDFEKLFNLSEEELNEQALPAYDLSGGFSPQTPANTDARPRPNLKVIQGGAVRQGATDAAATAARTAAQSAVGAGAEAATTAARNAARTSLRSTLGRAAGRALAAAGARHVAAGATGIGAHPAVQAGLGVLDAAILAGTLGKAAYDYYTKQPEVPSEEPTPEPQAEPQAEPEVTPEAVPQAAPQAAPALAPVAVPTPTTSTQTQNQTRTNQKKQEEPKRKRILPLGLGAGTPSPATDSNAASGFGVSKYTHMAKPYVKRQQVKEDATEERSEIENVARPNSRREKAVKQQEIQKKIIEEKKSLAQVVKKNIEDTKKEKNNSPVIINPTLNKPETGGY